MVPNTYLLLLEFQHSIHRFTPKLAVCVAKLCCIFNIRREFRYVEHFVAAPFLQA